MEKTIVWNYCNVFPAVFGPVIVKMCKTPTNGRSEIYHDAVNYTCPQDFEAYATSNYIYTPLVWCSAYDKALEWHDVKDLYLLQVGCNVILRTGNDVYNFDIEDAFDLEQVQDYLRNKIYDKFLLQNTL